MLSISQKQSVFQSVKKSFVIATKTFTPSVLYSNQKVTSHPIIMLNYLDEANRDQNAIGNFIGTDGYHGQRSSAFLSINVEAKDSQSLKAHDIAQGIADLLWKDIQLNWQSLASDTVKLKSISEIRNLTAVNQAANIFDAVRYEMDVRLAYDITW